jgi:hypothetical protein
MSVDASFLRRRRRSVDVSFLRRRRRSVDVSFLRRWRRCKAVYEPHRDKQNKQRKDFTLAYKKYAKGENMSPTGTNRTNKETKGLTQSTCKVGAHIRLCIPLVR